MVTGYKVIGTYVWSNKPETATSNKNVNRRSKRKFILIRFTEAVADDLAIKYVAVKIFVCSPIKTRPHS